MTRCDVLVVGAGPAGALAARELARRGASVLLVDRAAFPRAKVCGCCINGNALATLADVGLGDLVANEGGRPLTAFHMAAGNRSARVRLPAGMALSRSRFDAALVTAAKRAGATFHPETRAELGLVERDRRTVTLHCGEERWAVAATVVLAADGLGGRLLARAGESDAPPAANARVGAGVVLADAPADYRPGTIHMACGRGGYAGLVRLEDGRLDLAAAFDVGEPPPAVARRLLESVGWPVPADLDTARWHGTPALTRTPRAVAAERVFALGDAAGYVEPFTGEGMAWALASAVAVTPLALAALVGWREGFVAEWAATHRRTVGRRQLACRLVAAGLRRPALVAAAAGLLRWMPGLAAPLVRALNRPTLA